MDKLSKFAGTSGFHINPCENVRMVDGRLVNDEQEPKFDLDKYFEQLAKERENREAIKAEHEKRSKERGAKYGETLVEK